MPRNELARDLIERLVDQSRLAKQRCLERLERRRARGEALAVASELELRIDPIAPRVGQVVDVEAREVACLVGRAEGAESGAQGVVAGCCGFGERREPRPFGKEASS